MAYIHERADGTAKAHPHKLRVMLESKIGDLLSRYTLDEVLSEIAAQRPTFDIRLCIAGNKISAAKPDAQEVERSA